MGLVWRVCEPEELLTAGPPARRNPCLAADLEPDGGQAHDARAGPSRDRRGDRPGKRPLRRTDGRAGQRRGAGGLQQPASLKRRAQFGLFHSGGGQDRPQRATAAAAVAAGPARGGNFLGGRCTPRDDVTNGLVGGPDTQAHVHQQTPTRWSRTASREIGVADDGAECTGRILVESNLSRLVESNLSQRRASGSRVERTCRRRNKCCADACDWH